MTATRMSLQIFHQEFSYQFSPTKLITILIYFNIRHEFPEKAKNEKCLFLNQFVFFRRKFQFTLFILFFLPMSARVAL